MAADSWRDLYQHQAKRVLLRNPKYCRWKMHAAAFDSHPLRSIASLSPILSLSVVEHTWSHIHFSTWSAFLASRRLNLFLNRMASSAQPSPSKGSSAHSFAMEGRKILPSK